MEITYDSDVDILYIALSDTPPSTSEDITPYITVEYGPNGEVVAIELLEASKQIPRELGAAVASAA